MGTLNLSCPITRLRLAEGSEKDKRQQLDEWRSPLLLLLCRVLQTLHISTARHEVSVPNAIDRSGRARRGLSASCAHQPIPVTTDRVLVCA